MSGPDFLVECPPEPFTGDAAGAVRILPLPEAIRVYGRLRAAVATACHTGDDAAADRHSLEADLLIDAITAKVNALIGSLALAVVSAPNLDQLAALAEHWPFGQEGHLWQTHEKRDFAKWLRTRARAAERASRQRGECFWCPGLDGTHTERDCPGSTPQEKPVTNHPVIEPGDCIHLAIPMAPDPLTAHRVAESMTAAYEQIGVRVFMVDHVHGLPTAQVLAVVRGVDPTLKFVTPPPTP
jgi:hypothetical protein